jgi:catalase
MVSPASAIPSDKQRTYEELIDALQVLFGKHPGFRPVHAKGVLCEGRFIPAKGASTLCRASLFRSSVVPVTVRFSDFTGIPTIPDSDPDASPRGMAIRFQLSNGGFTDIVAHSYNGFPVGTAEEFLEFLRALAMSGPDSAKPSPIEVFLGNRPRAKQFAETPKPAPESFATGSYYAVDALRFTNGKGKSRYGRYRIVPVAPVKYLDPAVAATRAPNYLFDALKDRIKRGPIQFRLTVQLASEGDPITDASQPWPDNRPQLELGLLSITGFVVNNDSAQRRLFFDPAHLVDGIEPSDDPLIRARSELYAISFQRRNSQQ